MALLRTKNLFFVCIGNELRGDDYIGIYLGKKLMRSRLKERIFLAYSTPENCVEEVLKKNPDVVIFLDAVQAGQEAGTIILKEIKPDEPVGLSVSTHSIPIETVASIIRSVSTKRLGFYVLGIQVGQIEFGKRLSKEVTEAANSLLKAIVGFYY